MLGGGDPAAILRSWPERINHVHLKDALLSVMKGIVDDSAAVTEAWSREAFCPLGSGDLDVEGILAGLRTVGFQGWLVVEQDTLLRTAECFARAAEDQRYNRCYLSERGL
jgi:inosose dehydratase